LTASEPNAFTDGERIVIHSGILRLIRTDSDLAIIIGHELAHVNLGHITKKRRNAFIGLLGGRLVDGGFLLGGMHTGGAFAHHFERSAARAFSVGFEREADYVGAYYATHAGYDISGAENFWRAMGQEHPKAIVYATTHSTSPERFILMKKVIEEIADKKRRQLPLEPELKAIQVEAEPAATRENNY
jgi:beta-barrel assembly-enhancing protease